MACSHETDCSKPAAGTDCTFSHEAELRWYNSTLCNEYCLAPEHRTAPVFLDDIPHSKGTGKMAKAIDVHGSRAVIGVSEEAAIPVQPTGTVWIFEFICRNAKSVSRQKDGPKGRRVFGVVRSAAESSLTMQSPIRYQNPTRTHNEGQHIATMCHVERRRPSV